MCRMPIFRPDVSLRERKSFYLDLTWFDRVDAQISSKFACQQQTMQGNGWTLKSKSSPKALLFKSIGKLGTYMMEISFLHQASFKRHIHNKSSQHTFNYSNQNLMAEIPPMETGHFSGIPHTFLLLAPCGLIWQKPLKVLNGGLRDESMKFWGIGWWEMDIYGPQKETHLNQPPVFQARFVCFREGM